MKEMILEDTLFSDIKGLLSADEAKYIMPLVEQDQAAIVKAKATIK